MEFLSRTLTAQGNLTFSTKMPSKQLLMCRTRRPLFQRSTTRTCDGGSGGGGGSGNGDGGVNATQMALWEAGVLARNSFGGTRHARSTRYFGNGRFVTGGVSSDAAYRSIHGKNRIRGPKRLAQ